MTTPDYFLPIKHGKIIDPRSETLVPHTLTAIFLARAGFSLSPEVLDRLAMRVQHFEAVRKQVFSVLAVKHMIEEKSDPIEEPERDLMLKYILYLGQPTPLDIENLIPISQMAWSLPLSREEVRQFSGFQKVINILLNYH